MFCFVLVFLHRYPQQCPLKDFDSCEIAQLDVSVKNLPKCAQNFAMKMNF